MKVIVSSLTTFVLGVVITVLIFRYAISHVDDQQLANYHFAEVLKGRLVANGESESVILLIRNFIEQGICKEETIQGIYKNKNYKSRMNKEIHDFYSGLDESPPNHVKEWLNSSQ